MPVTSNAVKNAIIDLFSKAQPSVKTGSQSMLEVTPADRDGVFDFKCYLNKKGLLTTSPEAVYVVSGSVYDLVSEVRAVGSLENTDPEQGRRKKGNATQADVQKAVKSLFQGMGIKVY